ncbi:hypothetical protein [Streptosporangium sp. NPDC087985]|uniref:hypothetical protein n=1 Tax=Streptosporangium sp. NPDC087985 TaxID=3366196 RepID=UPI0037FF3936
MYGSTIRNAVLAVAVAAAVTAAGVGGTAAPPTVSAGDGKAFTECIRSHGLPDFPEVTVSGDGLINFDIKGDRVDALSTKYGAAVRACESLLPVRAGLPGAPAGPSAPSLLP